MLKARIYITLKDDVLDPQGRAVVGSLKTLGFQGVQDARVGKLIELKLSTHNKTEAEKQVKDMCEKLLANAVIENYKVELIS